MAQEKFNTQLLKIKPNLRKGNEPFILSHGQKTSVSFLLIHGFTACPWEIKDLGEYLHAKGYNVYGMLLAGHGTKEEDLLKIKKEDWYNSVLDGYEIAKLMGDKVVVIGLSTGGTLALELAAEKSEIGGIVSLSSAVYFRDWTIVFSGIGKYFIKYNIRPLEDGLKPYYYKKRSVSALYELYKLAGGIKKELKKINQPILIIQSKKDETIKPESSEYIFEHVSSSDKKMILLDNAPHVLTTYENPEQKKVFEIINRWITERL